ncbi:hypothetical protein ACOSOMT5_P1072 [Acidiphilium sp. MT5]
MQDVSEFVGARPRSVPNWRETLRLLRTNPIELWPEAAYHEPVIRLNLMTQPMLVISDPDLIHHVLIGHAENYRRTAAAIRLTRPLIGRGLLLSTGPLWRRQRRIVATALAPRSLEPLIRSTAQAINVWLGSIESNIDRPVDLLSALQTLALDIATRSMFSMTAAPFAEELRVLLNSTAAELWRPDALDLTLPAALPSPRDLLRWRLRQRWTRLISRIIAQRLTQRVPDNPEDLLDLLRVGTIPDGPAGRRQLRDEIGTLLIAGHETTALALFWSCLLLAGDQQAQERIAREAADLDLTGTGAAIAAMLDRLVFTRAVVSEALRLFPPASIIARQAIHAVRHGDQTITRGTILLIAPWVLHRHHAFWPNPELFDPTRFLPGAASVERFAYLPFGAGPRVCVGAQFAMAEATLSLAALMRTYRITRTDNQPVKPVVILTTRPDHAPGFRLVTRHCPIN